MTISITLTTFADFCTKMTAASRVAVVRKAIDSYAGYERVRDPYKDLRDCIIQTHKEGETPSALQPCLTRAWKSMAKHYETNILGYAKFMGRKKFIWLGALPPRSWRSGDLAVSVNPELSVAINGKPHILKLYFKSEPLSKVRAGTSLHLLRSAFPGGLVGIVDVRRGRLILPGSPRSSLDYMLNAEAAAFVTIWKGLTDPGSEDAA